MSFKDLGEKNVTPRQETPEEAELRAKAAAKHRAREAKKEEHRAGKHEPPGGGASRREPAE
jgi:hypothetical protein